MLHHRMHGRYKHQNQGFLVKFMLMGEILEMAVTKGTTDDVKLDPSTSSGLEYLIKEFCIWARRGVDRL